MIKMNKKGIRNTPRRGAVTIEFAFGIIAAAVVLMLILGIFNDNVKEMVDASRFQNLFAENEGGSTALDDQTKYKALEHDPTQNIIGTAGTQGLAYYKNQAIEGIKAILADGNIDGGELLDLARYLAQYAATVGNINALTQTTLSQLGINNDNAALSQLNLSPSSKLNEVRYSKNIEIDWKYNIIQTGGKRLVWSSSTSNSPTLQVGTANVPNLDAAISISSSVWK